MWNLIINAFKARTLKRQATNWTSRFVHKLSAVPTYLEFKLGETLATRRKRGQLQILPLRDLGHPEHVIKVEYSIGKNNEYEETVGIYSFEQVYLHRRTGLSLFQIDHDDWPVGIKESSNQEFQQLAIRNITYRKANEIVDSKCATLHFESPCLIFAPKNDSYFHFLVDYFPKLLMFLNAINTKVLVIHFFGNSGPISEYFKLLRTTFDCEFLSFEKSGSEHLKITSKVFFMEDTFRRVAHSPKAISSTWDKLKSDTQMGLLGLSFSDISVKSKRRDQMRPLLWGVRGSRRYFKNSLGVVHHSTTSLESVYKWGKIQCNHEAESESRQLHIFIQRGRNTIKRFIDNESEIISAIPTLEVVDFAAVPVREQIKLARRCSILVGLTGAGLANALFMDEGSLVIEIAPLGYSLPATDMVENICRARGLRYEKMFSTEISAESACSVDVNELSNIIIEAKQ